MIKLQDIKIMKESKYLQLKGFLSFLILHEISYIPRCGGDLAEKIGRRKGTTLTAGTIYPALKKLRKQKLVRLKKAGRKKVYFLTIREKILNQIPYS